MRRVIGMLSLLALFALGSAGWRPASAQDVSVEGAWILTAMADSAGKENSSPLPGLFIFTGTHYSVMFATGDGSRPQYTGETATDKDMIAAYRTFTANSGRYQVDGDQVTMRAFVAKNPNFMGAWPDNAYTVSVHLAGDTMHWTWSNGGMFTLRRVEGSPAPWDEE